jgi:tripartite-type tricarboxylate transporter receptor subunit TctC
MALSTASERVAQSQDFRSKLEPLGVIGASLAGPAFAEFQKSEIAKWGKAVAGSGMKIQ